MRSIVFIHIPKTAGTSVKAMLHQAMLDSGADESEIFSWTGAPDLGWARLRAHQNRRHLRLVQAHMPISYAGLFYNPYLITVLRNPVERVLSSYFHLMRITGDAYSDQAAIKFSAFPFVKNIATQYLQNHDIEHSTTFIAPAESQPLFVGMNYLAPTAVNSISIRQRKYQYVEFALRCSDDNFVSDIRDVPISIAASNVGAAIEISVAGKTPPAMSWRVCPLSRKVDNPMHNNWYVTSVSIACSPQSNGQPIGSTGYAPTSAAMCFDGRNAPSMNDLDGADLTREHLAVAKRSLRRFDAIGDAADLSAFFTDIAKETGLPIGEALRENINPASNPYVDVPRAVIEKIAENNALDIELYRYAFSPATQLKHTLLRRLRKTPAIKPLRRMAAMLNG